MKIGYAIGRHIITEITKKEYDDLSNLLNGNVLPVKHSIAEEYITQYFKDSLVTDTYGYTYIHDTKFNEDHDLGYLARYLVRALDHRPKYFKILDS